jgi:hypothetical protein
MKEINFSNKEKRTNGFFDNFYQLFNEAMKNK